MFRLLFLVLLLLNLSFAKAETLDKIVAIVNDQAITQSQLDNVLEQMHKQIEQNHLPAPNEKELRQDALNQLINQSIELQLAEKANLSVTPEELDRAINSIAAQNHLSVAELREKLQAQNDVTFTQFEQQIRQQILIDKLVQMAVGPKVEVTEAQINKAINTVKLQQVSYAEYDITDILIPLPENPTAAQVTDANQRATELIKQLKEGKKVSELITMVEETPGQPGTDENKSKLFAKFIQFFKGSSGRNNLNNKAIAPEQISAQDLGLRKQTELPEAFVAQLAQLKTSGIAGPIQTANGLHILRLNEIKTPATASIDRNQIRAQLYQQGILKELPTWLKEVRKTAYIKINN